jgi:hypothetical protein
VPVTAAVAEIPVALAVAVKDATAARRTNFLSRGEERNIVNLLFQTV